MCDSYVILLLISILVKISNHEHTFLLTRFRMVLKESSKPFPKLFRRKLSRLRRISAVRQAQRSLCGFVLGLFLASIYGMTALYIQNHNIWFCVITTGILAALFGFGSGLSDRVRTNVMLMLPMLCSSNQTI